MNSASERHDSKIQRLTPLLLAWYAQTARDLPWRRTRDPYAIWVSEIMLQQTQVKTVLPYWQRWMSELPTIEALADASSDKIHKLWEGLGYYTRVRNLQRAARLILEKHQGRFPSEFDDVLDLPGIGRYTAGAICSIAFDHPTPVLDGNVIRILTRIFGIEQNPREKSTNALLWSLAERLVIRAAGALPKTAGRASALNQSLMELGALVCTPRDPKCGSCPVIRHCAARQGGLVDRLPNQGPRLAPTRRHFAAFVIARKNRYFVRQRPPGTVNAHLWEFPNVDLSSGPEKLPAAARRLLGFVPNPLPVLCVVKHTITRYRITLEAFLVRDYSRPGSLKSEGQWLELPELRRLSFPSAHKKILTHLARVTGNETGAEENPASKP